MKEDFITQVGFYFLWFSREKWWSAAEEEEEAASRERQWAEHKGVRAACSFPFIKTVQTASSSSHLNLHTHGHLLFTSDLHHIRFQLLQPLADQ